MSKFDAIVGNGVELNPKRYTIKDQFGTETELTQEEWDELNRVMEANASRVRRPAHVVDRGVDGIRFIGDTHISEWNHWIGQRRSHG